MSNSLCIVAIFKNESHIIKEWIEHYLYQGVDKFFMIDNGSTDNYYNILEPYIKNNKVELVIDPTKFSQTKLYNKYYLNKCKAYEWVIVCDLDEFIYGRKYCNSIKDFLSKVHNSFSQVFIPWKMFGSNYFDTMDKEQPCSVISSFTKRINNDSDKYNNFRSFIIEGGVKYIYSKCIVRTKYLLKLDIHSSNTSNKNYLTSYIQKNNHIHKNESFIRIDEEILENSALHLNHYAIQSLKWFMDIKATRGDACNMSTNNIRDKTYFDSYNFNDIDDLELCNLLNNK